MSAEIHEHDGLRPGRIDHYRIIFHPDRRQDLERAIKGLAGLVILAGPPIDVARIAETRRHKTVFGAQRLLIYDRRPLEKAQGLVKGPGTECDPTERHRAVAHLGRSFSKVFRAQLDRFLEQNPGIAIPAEVAIRVADRIEQTRPQHGLIGEFVTNPIDSTVEHRPG